jgi:hypothetical protein
MAVRRSSGRSSSAAWTVAAISSLSSSRSGVAFSRRRPPGVDLLRQLRLDVFARRSAPLCHQVVLHRVDRDPVDPGVERALPSEARQRSIRLEERLLADVHHLRAVAEVAADQAAIFCWYFSTSSRTPAVAPLSPQHQGLIGLPLRHRRRLSPWFYAPDATVAIDRSPCSIKFVHSKHGD